ncbi:MAG: hypothetical protein QOG49_1053, partial [Frankiaceae bacterium]|nr:hypothetical protein [Frankiaceae bacterium]
MTDAVRRPHRLRRRLPILDVRWPSGAARRGSSELDAALRALGSGDLTWVFGAAAERDLGDTARAVNVVAERMRSLVAGLIEAADALEINMAEVDEIGSSMMSSAEETASQAIEVSAAAKQVAASTQLVAAATDQLSSTMRSVAESAVQASDMSTAANERASVVQQTVGELTRAARSVGDITAAIADIARQSRLVSLNARIESAQAGAAGQTFDVVATEMKELARRTTDATHSAEATLAEIHAGSDRAAESIASISSDISLVTDLQSSIATMVEEQTYATADVSRASVETASAAGAIEGNIEAIAGIARAIAYGGPAARNTASEIGQVNAKLRRLASGYRLSATQTGPAQPDRAIAAAMTDAKTGVTTVTCDVAGTGQNEFEYVGRWCLSAANELSGDADAYSSMPGDEAVLRFSGRELRLYCNVDAHHGKMGVSLDGGAESVVDQYSADRRRTVLLWQRSDLAPGPHVLHLRVLPEKNSASRYFWIT